MTISNGDDEEKEHVVNKSDNISSLLSTTTSNNDEGLSTDDSVSLSRLLLSMENTAQEDVLPIPAFTALLVLLGSLYVTFYGIYVGLNGFPDTDSPLPRIF
jgi:hypothetical protein